MLLSKEIVVYLNLAGCRVRQYTSSLLRKNNINLTPEQFLTIDILWNQGAMSYLLLLFALVSCGTAQEVYEPTGQRFVYRLDGKPEICCPDASCCDSAKKIAGGESALLYGMDSYKYAFLLAQPDSLVWYQSGGACYVADLRNSKFNDGTFYIYNDPCSAFKAREYKSADETVLPVLSPIK